MTIRSLLSQTIPPLRPEDTVERALAIMLDAHVRRLPVVDTGRHLVGIVSEDQLLDAPDADAPVGLISATPVSVLPDLHAFGATRILVDHSLTTLPVVGPDGHYVGLVERHNIFDLFARMLSTQEKGAIVIVEVRPGDYSLGQLAHVVEQSDAKVLSFSTEAPQHPEDRMRITLKLNIHDTARIRAVLEHHGYKVVAAFDSDVDDEDLQYRINEFMRYLEV